MMEKIKPMEEVFPHRPHISKTFLKEIEKVVGNEDLKKGEAELLAHSHDYWLLSEIWFTQGKIPAMPEAIVYPENTQEVVEIVKLANSYKVPIVPYGGGTGVVGGAIPTSGGLVVDLKKMNKILKIDDKSLLAWVQPGINGWRYEEELNRSGFTGGNSPQSLPSSTIGGWIACKAAGHFSTKYGKTEDLVVGIEAVMPDGSVVRSKPVPRSSTGPRLEQLLLGSEGTLGIITEAILRIFPFPEKRIMLSFSFDRIDEALEAVRKIMRRGLRPAVIRLYDETEIGLHFSGISGIGKNLLIFLLEGDTELTELEEKVVRDECKAEGGSYVGSDPVERWLKTRFDVSYGVKSIRLGLVVDTIEVAIGWDKAADLYHRTIESLQAVEGTVYASGHFSHFYENGACLYLSLAGSTTSSEDYYWKAWDAVMRTTLSLGGTISHHHGIGIVRSRWMKDELGEFLNVLKRVKSALDPQKILNRGKLGWSE